MKRSLNDVMNLAFMTNSPILVPAYLHNDAHAEHEVHEYSGDEPEELTFDPISEEFFIVSKFFA